MKCFMTGGGGFLGSALAKQLIIRGHQVTCMQRSACPELEALGIRCIRASISDFNAVLQACEGQDVVFHVAAKAGIWGNYQSYHQINVVGTENVIAACKRLDIKKLIYTSSPSVVFDGSDEDGIDESEPYPLYHLSHYSRSKSIAEQAVLRANDQRCATVALRPHLIWGPGDNHLAPRLIAKARAGRLPLLSDKLVDSCYIDNAVHAHLQALDTLAIGSACAGKAYFISNGEPIPMPELINRILAAADVPPVSKRIPSWLAYTAGCLCELVYSTLRIRTEPPITRFVARQLSCSHWFNLDAAKKDLGYKPLVNMDTGMRLLAESLAETA